METSFLDKLPDRVLFSLIKTIIKIYEDINFDITDENFHDACDEAAKIIGVTANDLELPVDYNFIVSLYKLNENIDWDDKLPNQKFKRPIPKEYSFDTNEHRREYVRRTYTCTFVSYSDDILRQTVNAMYHNPDGFEYYDCPETYADYYDGETTDVEIDYTSIEEKKRKF